MGLKTNLVSYWKFDESSGNAADSKSTNTLVNNNTATYAAAKLNNGVVMNGTTQFLNATDNASLSITGNISISVWVKFAAMPSDRDIFVSKPNDAGTAYDAYHIELNKNGANYDLRGITSISAAPQLLAYASWNPTIGTYYHVVYTRDSTSGQQTLYVNGAQVGQTTNTTGAATDSTHDLYIGKFGSATALFHNGGLDELGIWSKVLSSSEVSSLYNSGNALSFTLFADVNIDVTDTSVSSDSIASVYGFTISASDTSVSSDSLRSGIAFNNTAKSSAPTWTNVSKS